MMSDLVSLVLRLRPEQGQCPAHLGRATQAWFLAELARHDPALAEQLHQGAGVRPYTLHLAWEPTPFLRVTSVVPALSAFLLQRWLPGLPTWIRLGEHTFEIAGLAFRAEEHPWAGQASYAEFVQGHNSQRPDELMLEFTTPTLFRSNNLDVPLPLPTLIFDGLIRKWGHFTTVPVDADLKDWIENHVAVNRYKLETHLVRFGGERSHDARGGFVGRCRFVIVNTSPDCPQAAQCHALARFAFYAGVGRRTTVGLGQCRRTGVQD